MLTDKEIKATKPALKKYKLYDQATKGLHLIIHPNGGKYWQLDYSLVGKRTTTALGTYPTVSLKEARDKSIDYKRLVEQGVDPAITKKEAKPDPNQNTFEFVAREWGTKQIPDFNEGKHYYRKTLERHVFPYIGTRAIKTLKPIDILQVLQKIEAKGFHCVSRQALLFCSNVFRFAVATQRVDFDITRDLKGALTAHKGEHFASITDASKIGALLDTLYAYTGSFQVASALKLAPLLFVRPNELRFAEWEDIDLTTGEWRYFITKTKVDHIVPLSTQAVSILKNLQAFSGRGRYVFPSRDGLGAMSENAVITAIRRMGIDKNTMSTHGFRAMARTVLDEILDYPAHLIEHQLAHKVKDVNGTAYNRTKHLDKRREMMQSWADYLDSLKTPA